LAGLPAVRVPIGPPGVMAGVRVAWVPFVSAGGAGMPPRAATFVSARVPPIRASSVPAVPVFSRSAVPVSLRPAVMMRGGQAVPVLRPPAGEPAPMVMA
jgi:hypothetical protein